MDRVNYSVEIECTRCKYKVVTMVQSLQKLEKMMDQKNCHQNQQDEVCKGALIITGLI